MGGARAVGESLVPLEPRAVARMEGYRHDRVQRAALQPGRGVAQAADRLRLHVEELVRAGVLWAREFEEELLVRAVMVDEHIVRAWPELVHGGLGDRSEERRVGKECRSR